MPLRIADDLDNNTGDYEDLIRQFNGDRLGIPVDQRLKLMPPSPSYNFAEAGWPGMDTYEEFMEVHHAMVESGGFARMKLYPNAKEVLWRLKEKGHMISIVTARYLRENDRHAVNVSTSEFLCNNNLPVDELHITAEKVNVIADVYLDDSPHNIEVLRAAGRRVIIFDQLYNRHLGGYRAHNWLEIEQLIEEIEAEIVNDARILAEAEENNARLASAHQVTFSDQENLLLQAS